MQLGGSFDPISYESKEFIEHTAFPSLRIIGENGILGVKEDVIWPTLLNYRDKRHKRVNNAMPHSDLQSTQAPLAVSFPRRRPGTAFKM